MNIKFYNLFASFKKKLSQTKHIPAEEKEILQAYRKEQAEWLLKYAKKIGKAILVFASCALLFFAAKRLLSTHQAKTFVVLADVNLRDAPNFDSNVVRVLHSQEKLNGSINGKWLEVKEKGNTYYVSKSMVEAYNSGSSTLLRWTLSIIEFIAKAFVWIATFIKNLYTDYETARAITILIASVALLKLYNKLAKEKNKIIKKALDKLCEKCGSIHVKFDGPYAISESSSLRTKVSYMPFSSRTTNSRGDTISTQSGMTPISKIVTVHTVLTRTDCHCNKCGCNYSKTGHYSYEDC